MKKEYVILAVIIVAIGLYLILRNSDRTHYEIPEVNAPESGWITGIDVMGPAGSISIRKAGAAWFAEPEGYPIDRSKADQMVEAISGLDLVLLVSEAESYGQYDLTPDKRVFVEASGASETLMRLDVGKAATTHRHTYVRLEDDKNVYQAAGNIRRTFDVELASIRDKKVMALDRSAITGITVTAGGESLALTKISRPVVSAEENPEGAAAPEQTVTAWITADSTDADGAVVDGILSRVTNLQCDGFPEEGQRLDMDEPTYTLVVHGAAPDTLTIYGLSGEKMFLATSSQYDFPFMLSEWKVGQVKKSPPEVMGNTEDKE